MPTAAVQPLGLVVDDTPIHRTVGAVLFEQLGLRAATAESAAAAFAVLAAEPVDIVLMDCQMPGIDGWEAAARIRQREAGQPERRRVPIIALTGHDPASERERCLAAGMDDVLAKPLQLAALRAVVEDRLAWRRDRQRPASDAFRRSGRQATPTASAATGCDPQGMLILDREPLARFEELQPGGAAALIGVFLDDLATGAEAIGAALTAGDAPAAARGCHKLKGASATIGARALAAALGDLETRLRAGDLAAGGERWRRIRDLISSTREALAEALHPAGDGGDGARAVAGLHADVTGSPGFATWQEAMPLAAAVLDPSHRIVAANRRFLDLAGCAGIAEILGARPGNALGCVRADCGPGGCGTSPGCAFCGILHSLRTASGGAGGDLREARITLDGNPGRAIDMEVSAGMIELPPHRLILLTLRDIADRRRREALERLFFHDALNSASGLHHLAQAMAQDGGGAAGPRGDLPRKLVRAAQQLIDEIESQRLLTSAENDELAPLPRQVALDGLIRDVREACLDLAAAEGRQLAIERCDVLVFETDPVLLRRILVNLVKNAFEATAPGTTVALSAYRAGNAVQCEVRNPGAMPADVQQQLFQRSFSTKGPGRGLGAWSAKLLGERYLGGSISFTSSAADGTRLMLSLPLSG